MTAVMDPYAGSRALLARAEAYTPGGVHSARRHTDPPICVRSQDGGRVMTHDGREMIDYQAGAGGVILGHHDPDVDAALVEAVRSQSLVGIGTTENEVELCELLTRHIPSMEQVLLCSSGTEATMGAVRLARAVTGRTELIKFQGCYHGSHDGVWLNCQSEESAIGRPDPHVAGMLADTYRHTHVARYGDLDSVAALLRKLVGTVAAVIVEPIGHNGPGMLPGPEFLVNLRDLCDRYGVLLVFDEVITIRHGLGGVQKITGVIPDLTTIGKSIANGQPLSALGGLEKHMRSFDVRNGGSIAWNGTHNGSPLPVAAAIATIRKIERQGEAFDAHMFDLGDRMRNGLRGVIERTGAEATVCGYGSLFGVLFARTASPHGPADYDEVVKNDDALLTAFLTGMVDRDVLMFPHKDGWRSHIMAAHTEAQIDTTIEAAEESMREALEVAA